MDISPTREAKRVNKLTIECYFTHFPMKLTKSKLNVVSTAENFLEYFDIFQKFIYEN